MGSEGPKVRLYRPEATAQKPRTVGILATAYGDPYSLRVMYGATQELLEEGMHAVCFMGGFPHAPFFRDDAGTVRLPDMADAWVLLSETLRGTAAELEQAARCSAPCVSLGLELEAVPSITSNDETGTFQAIAHLARRHDRRRIAFVSGPEGSVDAARRLSAYRMAIDSLQLRADPALVVPGDYEARSGREAVQQLRSRTSPFDAIVAANDLMALGVIEGLKAMGRRVPEDVAVVGFDDVEEASFAMPALTTLRQPLQEEGASAARLAMRCLSGIRSEERTVIPTQLVIRESCGCRMTTDPPDRRSYAPGVDPVRQQGLLQEALRDIVRRELAQARLHRELSRLAEQILSAPDYPELAMVMTHVFRLLNLRRLALVTYGAVQRHARVALESSGRSVIFHHHSQPFPVEQILPAGFLRSARATQLCVEPLELAGERFGHLVLEGDVRDGHAYLELRRHLSSALARMSHGRELRRLYAAEKKRG